MINDQDEEDGGTQFALHPRRFTCHGQLRKEP